MSSTRERVGRLATYAMFAMALGPLTALTVASINNGTAGEYVAVAEPESAVPAFTGKRLSDVATSAGSLDFFSTIATTGQVKDLLRGNEQYTVFIPVNEAFGLAGGGDLSAMLDDPAKVEQLAKAHVVPGRISTTDLLAGVQVQSINGNSIASSVGPELQVNGATVIGSEVAENGVVHYVDRLL
jgi:uncharacterized surface protein with fasciclin (FAS1) repeats